MSSFYSLEVARRSLQSQQRALDVTGHNIANANTKGYSRQVVDFRTVPPTGTGIKANIGAGVEVSSVNRMRDSFLDGQYRQQSTRNGYWNQQEEVLNVIEVILNEPSEGGLRTVLNNFWSGVQDLSNNPESTAARRVVLETGELVVDNFRYTDGQLHELRESLDVSLQARIQEINTINEEILLLNQQIVGEQAKGNSANDLKDRRDLLLDQLSYFMDVDVAHRSNGSVDVYLSGNIMVNQYSANRIVAEIDPENDHMRKLVWEDGGHDVTVKGGQVASILSLRDETVVDVKNMLLDLWTDFANSVNELHATGYGLDGSTGHSFFVNVDHIRNAGVNPELHRHPEKLATADAEGQPGNSNIARKIADLRFSPRDELSGATYDDFYRGLVADVGVLSSEAKRMAENGQYLSQQIDMSRQSVQGVNLDEELMNMIKYQHAYSAAARMITTVDEMLDLIINRMGVVGR